MLIYHSIDSFKQTALTRIRLLTQISISMRERFTQTVHTNIELK